MTQTESLQVEVVQPTGALEYGKRFEIVVRRRWPMDHIADDFDETTLAPLRVRRIAETKQEANGTIEATIRFHAWVFAAGKFTIPALELRSAPSSGGSVRIARSEPLELEVRAITFDRPIELPREPFPAPSSNSWKWGIGAGAVFATFAFVLVRRSRVARRSEGENWLARTRKELAELRKRNVESHEEWHEESRALSALLRTWIERNHDLPATRRTTEEFLRAPETARTLGSEQRATLASFLEQTDRVKFARHAPSSEERDELYRVAESLLAPSPTN